MRIVAYQQGSSWQLASFPSSGYKVFFSSGATWLLTDSTFFLPAFSLVFLPSSILLSHWPKAASLLTNDNETYSQHAEGNPK